MDLRSLGPSLTSVPFKMVMRMVIIDRSCVVDYIYQPSNADCATLTALFNILHQECSPIHRGWCRWDPLL